MLCPKCDEYNAEFLMEFKDGRWICPDCKFEIEGGNYV